MPSDQHSESVHENRPETYFASASRERPEELERQVEAVASSPVTSTILVALGGIVAILNRKRQILSVNHAMLENLGIDDGEALLGLRPGEAIGCQQVARAPAGCGTGELCSSCGAAIAIVVCADTANPCERECSVTVVRDGTKLELDFAVRTAPLQLAGEPYVLLMLRDISSEKTNGAVARSFLHDLNNALHSLTWASEALRHASGESTAELITAVQRASRRLITEVAIQRALAGADHDRYPLAIQPVAADTLFEEAREILHCHPAASGKDLVVEPCSQPISIRTDQSLLLRVLTNMLVNAFEATAPGGTVRLGAQAALGRARIWTWNEGAIAKSIAGRIFHRNYTTKAGTGRGIGTYAMRFFTERFLGGSVGFSSGEGSGTTFYVDVPLSLHA